MSEVTDALTHTLQTRRELLLEAALQSSPGDPDAAKYGPETIEQLAHAMTMVMLEALAGESREVRDFLLTTALPGMLADGMPIAKLMAWQTRFAALASEALGRDLDPDQLEDAMRALAQLAGPQGP